jgi:hypothetical protein
MASSPVQGEEIEVTPEMIEACAAVLYAHCAIEHTLGGADRLMIAEIYKSMRVERKRCCKSISS